MTAVACLTWRSKRETNPWGNKCDLNFKQCQEWMCKLSISLSFLWTSVSLSQCCKYSCSQSVLLCTFPYYCLRSVSSYFDLCDKTRQSERDAASCEPMQKVNHDSQFLCCKYLNYCRLNTLMVMLKALNFDIQMTTKYNKKILNCLLIKSYFIICVFCCSSMRTF